MMHSLVEFVSYGAQRGLLAGAAMIVARERRSEWRKEWRGELWHVRDETRRTADSPLRAESVRLKFCMGAFADAWCLRGRVSLRQQLVHRSALDCILCLACALCVCAPIAYNLSGVRAEQDAMRYRVRPGVILIEDAQSARLPIAAISPKDFRDWQSTKQRFFDAIAYYRSSRERVALGGGTKTMQIAQVSPNLFAVLGVPLLLPAIPTGALSTAPQAVLSYKMWVREFDADPTVIGHVLNVGGETLRIVGVAPSSSMALPGDPAMWVLGSPEYLGRDGNADGFVIAHLSTRGQAAYDAQGDHIPIAVAGGDPDEADLAGTALVNESEGPGTLARFALFLAILALPAVVSVSLGESNFSAFRPSWKRQCLRWLFLAAKIGLVIAIAFYASLSLAYGFTSTYSPSAEFVQFAAGFVFSLLGLRWALFDQRHRCPVCLRHVTCPTRVGLASQTFLGWNGTEMFCAGGHTLLHVPALPTSWFAVPRWVYLDSSWGFLFGP
ncbi:MAG TPA: ABC transporter permease [Terracidiphilus sp.]|nr:ABC transporter permease [Terracidiphilus sp.]